LDPTECRRVLPLGRLIGQLLPAAPVGRDNARNRSSTLDIDAVLMKILLTPSEVSVTVLNINLQRRQAGERFVSLLTGNTQLVHIRRTTGPLRLYRSRN
jgi:hypothetical protein